jgi:hypothetical protein
MKIIQTDNQIELKSSGISQLIVGVILILAGVAMAIFLPGSTDSNGNKMPVWIALIGIALAIGGLAAVIFAKNRYINIQRGGNTIIQAKRMIGGSTQTQTIPTSNIVAVRLSTYLERNNQAGDPNFNNGNRSMSRRSVLALVLNNNDLVQVSQSSSGGLSFNGLSLTGLITKAPLSKEANQVASFLGVPLQADDTSSIAGAVNSIKATFGQNEPQQPTGFAGSTQIDTQPSGPPVSPPTPPSQPPEPTPPVPPQEPPIIKPPDTSQPT